MNSEATKELPVQLQRKLCLTLLNEIQDYVFLTTEKFKIIIANYHASSLFGRSESLISGCYLSKILTRESVSRCDTIFRSLRNDGETMNIQLTLTDYTGCERDFTANIQYLSLEGKDNYNLLFILRDRSGTNANHQHYIDPEHQIKRLLQGYSDSVMLIDFKSSLIRNCNQAAEIMFGYSREEIIGRSPQFLICSEDKANKIISENKKAYSSVGYYQGKILCKKKNGSQFMTLSTNIPLFNNNNKLEYIIAITRDITNWEKSMNNIFHYAEQSKQLMEKLCDSINPLKTEDSSINLSELGFSERQISIAAMLLSGEPTKKIAAQLNISESSVKRHLSIMYRRAQVFSRVEFVKFIHDGQIRIE